MNKDLKIGQTIYYNTMGAFKTPISQIGEIVDIGRKYIWVQITGNVGPLGLNEEEITLEPKYRVTNKQVKFNY